jgi:hypothetical protein
MNCLKWDMRMSSVIFDFEICTHRVIMHGVTSIQIVWATAGIDYASLNAPSCVHSLHGQFLAGKNVIGVADCSTLGRLHVVP